MKALSLTSLAAALLVTGLGVAPSIGHANTTDPEAGVSCPAGYQGQVTGNTFRCSKLVSVEVTNSANRECLQDAPFSNFQKMTNSQRDICVHQDSNIPSNANLAEFENGKILVPIPVGTPLPRNLLNRTPVKVRGNLRFYQINPNADFVFYDQSRTLKDDVNRKRAVTEIRERMEGPGPNRVVSVKVLSYATTQADFSGSLDKIEAKMRVSTLPQ